jgi:hypothetical protein
MGGGNQRGAPDSARVHTLFWSLSGLLVLIAFLSTSYTRGITSTRYLVPEFYALGALLPVLLPTTGRRWAGALAATAVALGSAAAIPAYTWSVESQYGQPSAVYQVGRWTVYVYPYDVARRFGPPTSI